MSENQQTESDDSHVTEPAQGSFDEEFQGSLQQQVSQAVQPIIHDLQGQIVQIVSQQLGSEEGNHEEQAESSASQEVFQQTAESLRETFELLGITLRKLLETVRALLKSVGLLLRALLTAISQGLQSAREAIESAIRARIIRTVVERVKHWIEAISQRLFSLVRTADEAPQPAES